MPGIKKKILLLLMECGKNLLGWNELRSGER